MDGSAKVDFGKTAKDYAQHRAGFPESFFERMSQCGWIKDRRDVLDLGTGTGTVARGLAKQGHSVTGVDPSVALLEEAKILDREEGIRVAYLQGAAEATGLDSQSFDVITAGQCWHWFNQEKALGEIRRLLRPNGVLVVAYFDWLNFEGNPVDLMVTLRRKYNPAWKSGWPLGFYPQGPGDLKFSDLVSVGSFHYQQDVAYTHLGWRGRMRAYAGIGGSLPETTVEEFDQEFARALKETFPNEPMQIPPKVWAEAWRLK